MPVTIEIDGRIVAGTYDVTGNTIAVSTKGGGFKIAHISGNLADAEHLAAILLGELVREKRI